MTNKNDGINRPPQQDNKNKSEDKMNYITKEKRDEVLDKTFTFPNGIVQAYQEYRNVNELLYQGHDVDPEQVALCMAGIKIARLIQTPTHADSWLDLAGYAAVGSECAKAALHASSEDNLHPHPHLQSTEQTQSGG